MVTAPAVKVVVRELASASATSRTNGTSPKVSAVASPAAVVSTVKVSVASWLVPSVNFGPGERATVSPPRPANAELDTTKNCDPAEGTRVHVTVLQTGN